MSVAVTNPPLLKKVLITKNGTRALIVRVYSTSKIGGRHMWRDIKNAGPCMFSNALGERLIAANLSGLVYSTYEEAWK